MMLTLHILRKNLGCSDTGEHHLPKLWGCSNTQNTDGSTPLSLTAFLFEARIVLSEGSSKRSIRSDVQRRFASYGARARRFLHQNVTVTASANSTTKTGKFYDVNSVPAFARLVEL